MTTTKVLDRIENQAYAWHVVVEQTFETESSVIAFGSCDGQPVVLKVLKRPGDEWRAGEIMEAFDGRGVVRVYEYIEGAVLLERLSPGNSLASMSINGRDEDATAILAQVIQKMSAPESPKTYRGLCDPAPVAADIRSQGIC